MLLLKMFPKHFHRKILLTILKNIPNDTYKSSNGKQNIPKTPSRLPPYPLPPDFHFSLTETLSVPLSYALTVRCDVRKTLISPENHRDGFPRGSNQRPGQFAWFFNQDPRFHNPQDFVFRSETGPNDAVQWLYLYQPKIRRRQKSRAASYSQRES